MSDAPEAGPAGLFFNTSGLSTVGWQLEHAARARLERWCATCGQPACYGYGETLRSAGVLSCADPECRAAAEAATAPDAPKQPDLFGEAA